MRTIFIFLSILCYSLISRSDVIKVTPFDLKEGLWEVAVTHSMAGESAMPSVPPEVLQKMPPEQRARIEAMIKQGTGSAVRKNCVTKEKLKKYEMFSDEKGKCTREVVSSSSKRIEIKFSCKGKDGASDGTVVMEASSSEKVKGTMHSVTKVKGKNMNMDFTFDSKYLGPDCGNVK